MELASGFTYIGCLFVLRDCRYRASEHATNRFKERYDESLPRFIELANKHLHDISNYAIGTNIRQTIILFFVFGHGVNDQTPVPWLGPFYLDPDDDEATFLNRPPIGTVGWAIYDKLL